MTTASGHLRKLAVTLADTVEYALPVDDLLIPLNDCIGKPIKIEYDGAIHCVACGRKTNKSYNQGYCYPCLQSLPECDICIVKPEKCHYAEGTCRDNSWADDHCMQDHYIYLANSSGLKVGITRGTQIPTRWIDQGASQAMPIARVKNRLLSGLVEVAIKDHVSDRTDWRKMLKGSPEPVDLKQARDELKAAAGPALKGIEQQYQGDIEWLNQEEITEISYPVLEYPVKVSSLNLDKTPCIEATLMGIKGQYLVTDQGVLNIRKFAGYQVTVTLP